MRKPSWMLVIMARQGAALWRSLVTAAVVASTGVAFGGITNTIPYSDNFENYTNGTPLIDGTNGWYGDSNAIVVQTNTVRTGTNAAIIPENCILSNRFQNIASTNVWVLMDVLPGLNEGTNTPVVNTNKAAMFYINSNGNFVVHNGPTTNAYNSTDWVVTTNGGIGTNGTNWVSIQIRMDFTDQIWSLHADNILVTNRIGFVNSNLTNFSGFDVGNGQSTSYLDNVSVVTPAIIRFNPLVLTNVVMQGEWTNGTFQVWYEGMGVVGYNVTTNQSWLVLSPTVGSLTGQTADATNTISVTYTNTSGLMVGTNYGTITIASTNVGGSTNTLAVILTVRVAPMLNVSPMLVTNTVMAGQNLEEQTLRVWNGSADDGIGYQVTTNAPWLTVLVTNNYLAPLTTNALTINYAVSSLTSAGDVPSNYFGTITVTATNASGSLANGSPVTIPVTVQVNPKPRIAFSPTNLSQTVLQGNDAEIQGFYVWNANGYYTLDYTISKGVTPWLVLTPTSGTSTTGQHQRIVVQYSTVNLPAGRTNAAITVVGWAWDGVHAKCAVETQTIVVALSVTPFATLTTDAQATNYVVRKGAPPPAMNWNVWNGGNPPNAMYFTVTVRPSASWLSVTPASGTSTGDMVAVRVQADTTLMNPGVVYDGTVQIDATDAGSGKPAYGSPQAFTIAVVLYNFKGFDFQGGLSGASDLVLYREANGAWEIRNLLSNYATTQFLGGAGYQAVPGDYTGDGVTEMGVYRPASGSWYAQQVGVESAQVIEMQQWVGAEYIGVPGDYDGDGKTDPGVYLERSGLWMVLMSGNGYQASGIFGGPGWTALLAGDYDGDCKMDPGVYHRASGLWTVLFSTSQSVISGTFGGDGFVPVPTDYDGDGLTDPAVYETATGRWYILPSTTLTSQGYSLAIYQFGGTAMSATLAPAPGNYDGAGGADLGLYDTTTWCWYIMTLDGVPLAWGYPMGRLGCFPVLP